MSDKIILEELRSIKRTVSALRKEIHDLKETKQSETWVKAKVIMDLTGWDAEGMRIARERKYITHREERPRVLKYLLESVKDEFKLKNRA